MEKTLKKVDSKWFLLFLFMFFGVAVQAQGNELEEVVIYRTPVFTPYVRPTLPTIQWNSGGGGGGGFGSGGGGGGGGQVEPPAKANGPGVKDYKGMYLSNAEFSKYKDLQKGNFHIVEKKNQIISVNNLNVKGVITKFEMPTIGQVFYYFTPTENSTIMGYAHDKSYYIPSHLDPEPSKLPENELFGRDLNTDYINDAFGFPVGGGYTYTSAGITKITILSNNDPVVDLNKPTATTPPAVCPNPPVCSKGYDLVNCGCVSENAEPFTDASKAGGESAYDAKLLHDNILEVLNNINNGTKFAKFKLLLKRGPRNNKAVFSKIPQNDLIEALKDLDPKSDQYVFATIVANTINSDKSITIKYFEEDILLQNGSDKTFTDPTFKRVVQLGLPVLVQDAYLKTGGGITVSEAFSLRGSGFAGNFDGTTYTFVNKYYNSGYSIITALHEFFGHGRPLSIQTTTTIHDTNDAILFENLAWRLLGQPGQQRNGLDHGGFIFIPNYNTALPSFR